MRWLHRLLHGAPTTLLSYAEPQHWRPRELTVRDDACPCGKFWIARYAGPVRLGGWFVLLDDLIGLAIHYRKTGAMPKVERD